MMSVANSSIAQLYIAYFNRAPEPVGYDFWCDVLDNPVTLEDIASDFATQPEAVAMYPLLEARTTDSLGDFLTTVYQNLFDRDPDVAGLEFWTGVIQGGADFGTILLKIIEGASEADQLVLDSKANVAQYWVETASAVEGYVLNEDAIDASRAAIEAANPAANSLQSGVEITDAYFADAAQVALTTVENDVRPGVLLFNPLKVADIAVTGDDPEQDDTVLGLAGEDADQFEIVGTELFLKAGGIVSFGSDKMMDVVVTLDDTRAGHFRMDGAESGAGLTLTQADIPVEGAPDYVWDGDDEFLVNEETAFSQAVPDVAAFSNNQFVVVWQSNDREAPGDTDGNAIKARIFDPDGDPDSDEFEINQTGVGNQVLPQVTVLPDDRFVVVWQSDDQQDPNDTQGVAIKARIFDADGDPDSEEFVVNENPQSNQTFAAIALLANGQLVVTWASNDGQDAGDIDNLAIKARIFDPDGDADSDEFLVNEAATNTQNLPKVAALPNGQFVVTWQSNDQGGSDQDSYAVKARIFDADGDPAEDEFQVNEFETGFQGLPEIAVLDNGNFVITWESADGGGDDFSSRSIKARIFDATGDAVTDEFIVNDETLGTQEDPAITPVAGGGFLVTWTSDDRQDDDDQSSSAIKGRYFDADGTPVDGEFVVNELPSGPQSESALINLPNGDIVAAWTTQDAPDDGFQDAVAARLFEIEGNDDMTVQRVVADLNPDADFTYDPAEMVGIPVEPDGGIV
jgi:hypothetical protein